AVLACTVLAATVAVTGVAVASTTAGQLAAAPGATVLLSSNRPVTASSASGCCAAKNAVDGKSTTRWASAAGKDPQWIYVDLGTVGEGNPPTPPGKPSEVAVSFDRATVAWAASTDDVGVVGYDFATGDRPCGSVAGTATSGTCTGLNPDTDYAITVTARDVAG